MRLTRTRLIVSGVVVALLYLVLARPSATRYQSSYLLPFEVPQDKDAVPRYIHQSYNTSHLPAHPFRDIPEAVASWHRLNPQHAYALWNDTDCEEFVRRYHPEVMDVYTRFPKNVMRADFFRYLVLLTYGGVYCDIDTRCLRPIDTWFENMQGVRAIVGVEIDASDDWKPGGDLPRQLQFTQWTMVAAPGHRLMEIVKQNVLERSRAHSLKLSDFDMNTVMELTGPGVFTDSVYEYMAELGEPNWRKYRRLKAPTQLGDLLIHPVTAFNPTNWDGLGVLSPQACVEHLYLGSWKDSKPKNKRRERWAS